MNKLLIFGILTVVVFMNGLNTYADKSGRGTRTSTLSNGCGSCHGNSPNSGTQVTLQSGATTVEPGSTNSYVIRVYNSANLSAGINIGIKTSLTGEDNIGTLSAGSGTKALLGELVQSAPKTASSGSADFDFTWKAPVVPGKYFMRAVGVASNNDDKGSGDSWNWMSVKEILVRGVQLTEPVGAESYCVGNQMILKWKSAAVDNIKIELSADGGSSYSYVLSNSFSAIGGNFTWNIPADFPQGGNYKIKISDVNDPNKKSESKNSFNIYGFYSITTHPQSKDLCEGESYKLYVVTSGLGLTYQWRKNGANIFNAKDSVYEIKNSQPGDEGYYGVVITSNCAPNISSSEALIKVRKKPVVKKQPQSVITCGGGTVEFQTEGDGQDIKYQWFKDAAELTNKTSANLQITNIQPEQAGKYWCKISGFCEPPVISDTALLVVNTPAAITKQPVGVRVCEKNKVVFKIEATGEQLSYRWYFKGNILTVPNSPELILNSAGEANIGKYYCMVGNPCGPTLKSDEAELSVDLLPKILSQSPQQTLIVGEKLELSVKLSGNIKSIKWFFNNKEIVGADTSVYTINTVDYSNAGDYYCTVANDCGEVKSLTIKITIIKEQPGARIALNSSLLDFKNIFVGYSADSTFVNVIKNIGDSVLLISNIIIEDSTKGFSFDRNKLPITIGAGMEESLFFIFHPISDGEMMSKLTFVSNSLSNPEMELKGFGAYFELQSEKTINFGGVGIEGNPFAKKISIFNASNYNVEISSIKYFCAADNPFLLLSPALPIDIISNDSINLEFQFMPPAVESYLCGVQLISNNPDTTYNLNFIGNGVTSIDENSDITLLSPNPATDYITININGINPTLKREGDVFVGIYDIMGILVSNTPSSVFNGQTGASDLPRIDISNLSPGVYFVKIIGSNGAYSSVEKFVKY